MSAFQCLDWTNLCTASAQNTFCCVLTITGVFANLYIHRTYFKALAAFDTFALIAANA